MYILEFIYFLFFMSRSFAEASVLDSSQASLGGWDGSWLCIVWKVTYMVLASLVSGKQFEHQESHGIDAWWGAPFYEMNPSGFLLSRTQV